MLMYRIAICDDEKSTCAEIESYILMYSKLRFIRIVIIITHRLDTISDVDKIFVMSEGRICEEGQHNELMKKGEKYYALVQNL